MNRSASVRLAMLLMALISSGCGKPPSPPKAQSSRTEPAASKTRTDPKKKKVAAQELVETADPDTTEDDPELPPKFRPPDRRPAHDDEKLAEAGIHRYESKRLILYTDIDPEVAAALPAIADQLHDALVDYFGPLPPEERGSEFQVTGYLIRDEVAFRELKLLEGVPTLLHGKHVANRFWMRDQRDDYYRRHLLLHEWTHCYMTYMPGPIPPVWYMEGMAELFGTHRVKPDGRVEFRILPKETDDVAGWGRIGGIRRDCDEGRSLTIRGVYDLPNEAFFQPEAYAWSWALCQFFDSHPLYAARFRGLGRHLHDGQFPAKFLEAFAHDERNLSTEWTLYEFQLQPGYDSARAAVEFRQGKHLSEGEPLQASVQAARGWQDVGLRVEPGDVLEIAATGRFTLADDVKPWISEPQGISIRYFNGNPLGRLLACLDADPSAEKVGEQQKHLLQINPIGKSARLTMPAKGRLLLRLNDAWDSLSDNEGSADVTIRRATP